MLRSEVLVRARPECRRRERGHEEAHQRSRLLPAPGPEGLRAGPRRPGPGRPGPADHRPERRPPTGKADASSPAAAPATSRCTAASSVRHARRGLPRRGVHLAQPDPIVAATQAVNAGAGVVHIVKNYTGDVMNFQIAAELAADEGIQVETVLVDDDVAVEDSLYTAGRRGPAQPCWWRRSPAPAPRPAAAGRRRGARSAGGGPESELRGGADLLHHAGRRPPDLRDRP